MRLKRYSKAIAAFFSLLGTWGVASAPGGLTSDELWGLCAVVAGTFIVFGAPRNERA